jgi:hypothetical protein
MQNAAPTSWSMRRCCCGSHGGSGGIRTPEGVNPTRFPSERHRPLGDRSVEDLTGNGLPVRNRPLTWDVPASAPHRRTRPGEAECSCGIRRTLAGLSGCRARTAARPAAGLAPAGDPRRAGRRRGPRPDGPELAGRLGPDLHVPRRDRIRPGHVRRGHPCTDAQPGDAACAGPWRTPGSRCRRTRHRRRAGPDLRARPAPRPAVRRADGVVVGGRDHAGDLVARAGRR